jgi:ribonucrease Y
LPALTLAITTYVVGAIAFLIGLGVGAALLGIITGNTLKRANREAEQITRTAESEAETIRQRAELESEKKANERREALDREIAEARDELKKDQQRLIKREDTLDKKLEAISAREDRLDRREADVKKLEESNTALQERLEADRENIRKQLQELSGMTPEQARERFMEEIRREAEHDAHALTQQIIEESELNARSRSREITLQAIQRYAAEHVVDSTVRSVRIPSDDMKGRIIGREGRNIRALERATGVDILVDDTPGVIAVSCFDPIRRAIAGEALSKLVADGRVHPSRIEEIVETVRKDMAERIIKHGNDAVMEANIRGLHPKIIEAMGKLAFRTSYGQNVLKHSLEVAYLCQIIADQLGLKSEIARRCGFLHDIGKAMDHEMEGGHPAIGMEFVPQVRREVRGSAQRHRRAPRRHPCDHALHAHRHGC